MNVGEASISKQHQNYRKKQTQQWMIARHREAKQRNIEGNRSWSAGLALRVDG